MDDLDGKSEVTGATALVATGATLMRVENETMLAVAVQRPRDEKTVLKGALLELDMVPEEAALAFYEIPYRERQPDGTTKMVKVTGPSIKAAMTLARRWGNCTTTARILNEDHDGIDLAGIFVDFESNFRVERPMRVSRAMKTRSGVIILDPKKLEMAIQAGASKAIRNAVLAGLPAYLVKSYDRRAREIAGGKLDVKLDEKTRASVVRAFAKLHVDQEQLEAYLELKADQWTGTERASLLGVYNAINDGQTTVAEVFGVAKTDEAPTVQPQIGSTTVTPDSLLGGTATGQDNVQPGQAASSIPVPRTPSPAPQAATSAASPQPEDDQPRPAATRAETFDVADLLAAIGQARARQKKPIPEWAWTAFCLEWCGTSDLSAADPAALADFRGALNLLELRDPTTVERFNAAAKQAKQAKTAQQTEIGS